MSKKHKPKMFGPASYATMAVIVGLAIAGAMTYKPLPVPAPVDMQKSAERFQAEQQGDLATIMPPKLTLRHLTHEAAKAIGIDPHLFHEQIMIESGGKLYPKRSRAGACGIAQFMPITIKELDVKDCMDPIESAFKGADYLKKVSERFGSPTLGLVAYNWGQGKTARWLKRGGKWSELPKETRDYVSKINVATALAKREMQVASK